MPTTLNPAQQRFTLDGSYRLEEQLEQLCLRVRRSVLHLVPPPKLQALVLGGGYGRGQGGVLQTDAGEAPYNDFEFYVFLRGNHLINHRTHRLKFNQLENELSPAAGMHVEFKIDSLEKFRRGPVSIFSYDLISGHRIVFGSESIFNDCQRHSDPANIAAAEGTRLLLNRCSGLLLAKELLLKNAVTAQESDFIGRNLAKAQLALGDAFLALNGQYHWDCLERARRLRACAPGRFAPMFGQVLRHHSAGVRFKLHPYRETKDLAQLRNEHRQLVALALEEWLWLENERLQTNFCDLWQYALSDVEKCATRGVWRNLLLNLRTFGPIAAFDRAARRYPRQRLLSALPLLLSVHPDDVPADTRRHLQRQLHTRAQDWRDLVTAYKRLWHCYG